VSALSRSSVGLQLVDFTIRQIKCCVFPFGVIAALAFTKVVEVPGLPRYDLMLILCLFMQWGMVAFRLETKDELKVVGLFHILGLALELHKTQMGSWSYPEAAYSKIGDVPLYSGFMYASVASYICQAWRRLDLSFDRMPPAWASWGLALVGYANFFMRGILPDLRWPIIALVFLAFWPTRVGYNVSGLRRHMPLGLSFVLIGGALWTAENIATYFGAWQYPNQRNGWDFVEASKGTSWFLLVIVSFLLVVRLKEIKSTR
jgi:uncharacterized membrane protein YoaT (DUF817 family)